MMADQVVKGKPLYVGLAEKREVRAERLRALTAYEISNRMDSLAASDLLLIFNHATIGCIIVQDSLGWVDTTGKENILPSVASAFLLVVASFELCIVVLPDRPWNV